MRSSRRNLGLNPEFTPEPTPPSSNDDDFLGNVQIESTVEEEARYRRQDEEAQRRSTEQNSDSNDNSNTAEHSNVLVTNNVLEDIVFSSEALIREDSSNESVKVIENQQGETKSSETFSEEFMFFPSTA